MLAKLKKLSRLMAPPTRPFDATGDWKQIEEAIGTTLPTDYKDFIGLYGSGAIGQMPIWIFNCLALGYKEQCLGVASGYQALFADSPHLQTYPLYPAKGGLLYCGSTGNGDYIHWLTAGPANKWTIVVHDFGLTQFIAFQDTLVDFIANVVSQEQKYDLFPHAFFEPPVEFTPTKVQFTRPERR